MNWYAWLLPIAFDLLEASDVARQSLVQVVDGAVRITCTEDINWGEPGDRLSDEKSKRGL